MHQIDAVAANDIGNAVRIPQKSEGHLGGGGKKLYLGAGVAQALHQPSALGQHDGAAAGGRYRIRNLYGGKLRPAGVEFRDDLQYGRALLGHAMSSGGERVV